MKKTLLTTTFLCLASASALAQTATGTGVGVANSSSQSAAGALAVNRGNGGNSTINIAPSPATQTINSNSNQNISGGTSNRTEVTGTSTVKNVPGTLAPGLAAAGLETCLGSVSGGGSIVGFGGSFGTTVPDPGCQARLDARTLWSMGLKSAAVARLCIREDIYRSMPDVCERYTPRVAPAAQPNYGYPVAYGRATSGPIEVVNGKTGQTEMCDDYNEARQKCLKWANAAPQSGAKTRVAAKPRTTASGRPIVMVTKKSDPSAPVVATAAPSTPQAAIAAATDQGSKTP